MSGQLGGAARALLTQCRRVYADSPRATRLLDAHLRTLDGPVRIAVTGPAAAGKSTLVGALSGSRALREADILDAPGPSDEPVDAVLHLIRNRPDHEPPAGLPVSTIAVLCRTDELDAGRVEALTSGRRLARRYGRDPRLRSWCQAVVPVAGLVALAGRGLTAGEFDALAALARSPRADLDGLLLSADRVVTAGHQRLLDRFGLFGMRLGTTLIRAGTGTQAELSAELVRRSGLVELREAIRRYFVDRGEVLKARSALTAVELVLRAEPRPVAVGLAAELELALTEAHELRELRLLSWLQADPGLLGELTEQAQRLVGAHGTALPERLELDNHATPSQLRHAAAVAHDHWQRHAADPALATAARRAALVVVRSCEGMLTAPPPRQPAG